MDTSQPRLTNKLSTLPIIAENPLKKERNWMHQWSQLWLENRTRVEKERKKLRWIKGNNKYQQRQKKLYKAIQNDAKREERTTDNSS